MYRVRYTFLAGPLRGTTGTFGSYTKEEAERIARCHNEGFGKRVKHKVERIDGPS